jgi:hypothetical protein
MGAYSLDQAQEQLARLVDEALAGGDRDDHPRRAARRRAHADATRNEATGTEAAD